MSVSKPNDQGVALRVCVDCAQGCRISGRVYSTHLTAPISFPDLAALLLRLDQVLDQKNFPQAFQRARSFTGRTSETLAAEGPEDGMSPQQVAAATGETGTFTLWVHARRHATWQGCVDWLDGNPSEPFESDLELLGLVEQHQFKA